MVKLYMTRAYNNFQVYQYLTIYRWYFLLKFEQFSRISYTMLNQEVPKFILGGLSGYNINLKIGYMYICTCSTKKSALLNLFK